MQKQKHKNIELHGELGEAFNFTQGDLEANRAGFISKRQADAVRKKTLHSVLMMQVLTGLFVGLAAMFIWGGFHEDAAIFCIAAPFVLFALILISLSLVTLKSMFEDLSKRRVEYSDCQAQMLQPSKKMIEYRLVCKSESFPVKATQYALLGDATWRVYHSPRNQDILAVEALAIRED